MRQYFSSQRIGPTLMPAFLGIMTSPSLYFEKMPVARRYKDSLTLLVIYLLVPALVTCIYTGLLAALVILPVLLAFGIAGTWLWAWYLAWASRVFCKRTLSTVDAFQICAYGAAPLVFSWVPLLGVLAYLWNLYLNWQGLISHARVGGGAALLIILASFAILGGSLLVLIALLFYYAAQSGMHIPETQWF